MHGVGRVLIMAFLDRIQNEIEELNGLYCYFSLFFRH